MTLALLQDRLGPRLRIACLVSIIINILLWHEVSGLTQRPPRFRMDMIQVSRVIMDKTGKKTEKIVKREDVKKKVAQVHKEIQRRKPPVRIAQKPPEGAHNRVLTAKPNPNAPAKPDDNTALAGGNAAVGKAIEQKPGDAAANPPEPVKKEPPPPPPPPKVEPKPEPVPVKVEAPKVEPKPEPKPEPPPAPKIEPPRPKGPTKEAEPDNQVKPEIPDDLKKGQYKAFVRVKVEINEDGSFTPILRTSSGNDEIDRRVLAALKRWKWKPALKDGVPARSTQLFKFEFEVD